MLCKETLCTSESVQKGTEILILADQYSASQLEVNIVNFINL